MRIHCNDPIDKDSFHELKRLAKHVSNYHASEEDLKKEIQEITVLVVRSGTTVTKELLELGARGELKFIIRAGVGLDNIHILAAKSLGIKISTTKDASSNSVAELTIALILNISRQIPRVDTSMRRGEFSKGDFTGEEIFGKTLGLIGFGHIGQLVAKKAAALGMNILYTNRHGEDPTCRDMYTYVNLDQLLKESSYISLHLPELSDAKPLLTKKEFEKMGHEVSIINTARGTLIEEEALLYYLQSGKVKAAALDVFKKEPPQNKEIYTHEKIILTPHIGSETVQAKKRVGEAVVKLVDNFMKAVDNV